jgi:hypothetical protein
MTDTIDHCWDKYVDKDIYSPLYDKVFECTSLDVDEDDVILLYCQERVGKDIYKEGIHFKEFEVQLI